MEERSMIEGWMKLKCMVKKELVMGYMCKMGLTKELGTRLKMGMKTRMIMGMVMGYMDRMIKEWACMDVQANKGIIS